MNYDFNNVNDLKSLISVLLDGYVPYQFEQFSAEIIEEAIKSLKQDEIELTGNIISGEAVKLGMFYADNRLDDLLNDDVMELTAAEQKLLIH